MINDAKTLLLRMEATLRKHGALDAGATTAQRGLVGARLLPSIKAAILKQPHTTLSPKEVSDRALTNAAQAVGTSPWAVRIAARVLRSGGDQLLDEFFHGRTTLGQVDRMRVREAGQAEDTTSAGVRRLCTLADELFVLTSQPAMTVSMVSVRHFAEQISAQIQFMYPQEFTDV